MRFLSFLIAATLLLSGADKKPKPKPAVVEIQNLKVTLDGRDISIDGKIRNSGERTIEKLILSFHFLDSDGSPVSNLQLELDDETIEQGEETEIHAGAHEPARSISLKVTAADRGERDLKVVNPGPYLIE